MVILDPKRVNTTLSALSSVARLSVSMTMLMSSGVYRPRLLDDRFILPKLLNPRTKGPSPQRRSGVLPRIESLPIMRNNSATSSAAKKQRRNRKSMPGKIGSKNGNGGGMAATDMTTTVEANEECSHVTIESTTSSCASGPEVEQLNDGGGETKEVDEDEWMESPINTSGIQIVIDGVSDDESTRGRQRQEQEEEEKEGNSSSGHATPSDVTPPDQLPGHHSGCHGSGSEIQIRPKEIPDCSVNIERETAVCFSLNKASEIEEEEEELSPDHSPPSPPLPPTAGDVTDRSSRGLASTPNYEEEEEEEKESGSRSRCHGSRQTTTRRRPVTSSGDVIGGGCSPAAPMSVRLCFNQPSTDSSVNGMTPDEEEGVEEEESVSIGGGGGEGGEDPRFPSAFSAGKSHQPSNSHSVMLSDT